MNWSLKIQVAAETGRESVNCDEWLQQTKTFTFIFSFKLPGPTCDHITVHTSQSTHSLVIIVQLTESYQCSVSSPPLTRTKSQTLQAEEELVCVETETGRVRPPLCSSSSSMWEGKVFTETVWAAARSSTQRKLVELSFNELHCGLNSDGWPR